MENIRVELSRATPHPLKAAAVRQSLGISFSLQKKKNPRKQGDMSVLLCGIIHFTLIPISQLKLGLNKQGLRLSEAAPTRLAVQETPLQDTGSGGQAWNRRICPFVSQVLSLIGFFRFSFLYIFGKLKVRQGRVVMNQPSQRGFAFVCGDNSVWTAEKNQSRESYKWWRLRKKAFFFFFHILLNIANLVN